MYGLHKNECVEDLMFYLRKTGVGVLSLLLFSLVLCGSAQAASPGDPVRSRYAGDFQQALKAYERLGEVATRQARAGLQPLDAKWVSEMKRVDSLLIAHEHTFFPMMARPWTREAAVFANLQGARMWLWSVHDGLKEGAEGVHSIDVVDGRVRAELLENFSAYLAKAGQLLAGGEFQGSYFKDTLTPVLADYCAYPEEGGRVKPDFDNPVLFDSVQPAASVGGSL